MRSKTGTTQETADAIPTAINLGGPDQVSTKVPSDVLQAASQADKTLQQTALFAGLLALAVGGLGIANVMSISVIQRSSEIGIRRAVGHSRSKIGSQFLLESLFVGVLGGILGAALGVGVVYLVSAFAHWVVVIAYRKIPIWMGLALLVSVGAGCTRRSRPRGSNRSRRSASASPACRRARARRVSVLSSTASSRKSANSPGASLPRREAAAARRSGS